MCPWVTIRVTWPSKNFEALQGYWTVTVRPIAFGLVRPGTVPATVRLYVPAGVALPDELGLPPPHDANSKPASKNHAGRNRRASLRRLEKITSAKSRASKASESMISTCRPPKYVKSGTRYVVEGGAVVVTVTVKPEAELPETFTLVGPTVQVDAGVGFEQDNATAPENPFIGVTCKLNVAVSPAAMDTEVDPPVTAASWKFVAVPVTAMC